MPTISTGILGAGPMVSGSAIQPHGHGPLACWSASSLLISAKIRCDRTAAWRLAALSCMVCGQQGVYRGPAGETMIFMAFGVLSVGKIPSG
jgi:hypothetical protein